VGEGVLVDVAGEVPLDCVEERRLRSGEDLVASGLVGQ